eukprot:TRINITY_DN2920_c0_g3_i1.p1 TRINITY_DN2920_c0_g3~~TRINITY_DN2920_c0_g3_i1.p1  ORF type:complete len:558 (-),score=91.54 TRINITY_DN2920_c0_g3_i1:115-1788(-)
MLMPVSRAVQKTKKKRKIENLTPSMAPFLKKRVSAPELQQTVNMKNSHSSIDIVSIANFPPNSTQAQLKAPSSGSVGTLGSPPSPTVSKTSTLVNQTPTSSSTNIFPNSSTSTSRPVTSSVIKKRSESEGASIHQQLSQTPPESPTITGKSNHQFNNTENKTKDASSLHKSASMGGGINTLASDLPSSLPESLGSIGKASGILSSTGSQPAAARIGRTGAGSSIGHSKKPFGRNAAVFGGSNIGGAVVGGSAIGNTLLGYQQSRKKGKVLDMDEESTSSESLEEDLKELSATSFIEYQQRQFQQNTVVMKRKLSNEKHSRLVHANSPQNSSTPTASPVVAKREDRSIGKEETSTGEERVIRKHDSMRESVKGPERSRFGSKARRPVETSLTKKRLERGADILDEKLDTKELLVEILTETKLGLIASLVSCLPVIEHKDLADSLLTIFQSQRNENRILHWAIKGEIERATSPANIFRENSFCSALLSAYFLRKGALFMKRVIRPLIVPILSDPDFENMRIDSVLPIPAEERERNLLKIRVIASNLFDKLFASARKFPR